MDRYIPRKGEQRMEDNSVEIVAHLPFREFDGLDHRINLLLTMITARPALVIIEIDFVMREPRRIERKEFVAYLLSVDDHTGRNIPPEYVRLKRNRHRRTARASARRALGINTEVPESPKVFFLCLDHFLPNPPST